MPLGIVQNNTGSFLSTFVRGPVSEAAFSLAPGQNTLVNFSFGTKALIAFAGTVLFAMRPINVTTEVGIFLIAPSGPPVTGGVAFSAQAAPEQVASDQQVQQLQQGGGLIQEVTPGN